MKVILTLISLVLVACGSNPDEQMPPANVAELNLYPSLNPDNISIGFGEVPANHAGECVKTNTQNFIVVDQGAWNALNSGRRKALIMHELGHCVYNRVHDNTLDSEGNINSIMFPDSLNNQQVKYFLDHEQHYINAMIYE